MINRYIIYKVMGTLLFIEATLMMWCLVMSFCYKEDDMPAFLVSTIVTVFFGFILKYMGRASDNTLSRRDAYLLVTVAWVMFSLFGTLPFLVSGYITNFTDAFFETMSGFTTTGATVVGNVERLPHGLLFWRSLTQWIGGLGIVFFTITIMPSMSGGSVKIFAAEGAGTLRTKLHPRLSTSALWIWTVYLVLTLACTGCYMYFGMNWFDGVNYAMTTTATGGFATHNDSAAFFGSPQLEYACIVFCFLSGINFALLYLSVIKLKLKSLVRSSEFRLYLFVTVAATLFVIAELVGRCHYDVEHALRSGLFQTVSFITSTGLFNDDPSRWPRATWLVLAACMTLGPCSGSTGGGIKCVRGVMLLKSVRGELHQMLHPNAVLPLRVDRTNVPLQKRVTLLAFLTAWLLIAAMAVLLLTVAGIDFTNAATIALSCLGNTGPALDVGIGSAITWAGLSTPVKWLCTALMLVGRLEIFSVLVIFTRSFWTKN